MQAERQTGPTKVSKETKNKLEKPVEWIEHTGKAKLEKAAEESILTLATTSKESKSSMHKHTTTLL